MQYTGLKDKNGKEIYEGDIYKSNGYYYEIIFHEGAFCVSKIGVFDPVPVNWKGQSSEGSDDCIIEQWSSEFEIIGNIYENPELLK